MNPFRNLILNLQATGPAAVLCVLIGSIAIVGVFGSDKFGGQALGSLSFALTFIGVGLVSKLRD